MIAQSARWDDPDFVEMRPEPEPRRLAFDNLEAMIAGDEMLARAFDELAEILNVPTHLDVARKAAHVLAYIIGKGGGKFWMLGSDGSFYSVVIDKALLDSPKPQGFVIGDSGIA